MESRCSNFEDLELIEEGDHARFAELLFEAYELDKFFPFLRTKGELAVHDAEQAMVVGRG